MNKWLQDIKIKNNKKAMPVLTFPAIQLLNKSVSELINDSHLQVEALKIITERCDPLAVLGFMDLSVEAECFGSQVSFTDDEVPNIIGSIVHDEDEAKHLRIPKVGEKRSRLYIETIKKTKQEITDRPVIAGCIGPFSLAGRLLDVTEAMIACYEEPDMVHIVLEKATNFLIKYIQAYKEVGADGVFIAEPLAGILSPDLCDEFSSYYIKQIVEAIEDDNFVIIYHNCGNNTLKMIDTMLSTGCKVFHFGNAIDIKEMVKKMPDDVIIMGNIDPVHMKDSKKDDIIKETQELLNDIGEVNNFIISSGCDIPPLAKWENIDAFMKVSADYYHK